MDKKIGFIGGGNMGSAIIGGILNSGLVEPSQLIVSDQSEDTLVRLKNTFGVQGTKENNEVAGLSDLLFLAVKPHQYAQVIREIKTHVKEDVIIVVIAAGQTISSVEAMFQRPVKVVRTMPNTPAMVGEGMTAVCPSSRVQPAELQEVVSIFNSLGKTEIVPETLMDTVTGVSGSSPAYAYMFIEALADGAVAEGMPRKQAYTLAAQALLGAAKMVLETGQHPGQLKDNVCSPGGTTIEAVCTLENQGFRNSVISAVRACIEKSKEMTEAMSK